MCHSDKEQQKKLAAGTVTPHQTVGVCSASAQRVKVSTDRNNRTILALVQSDRTLR